jgi:hypothetical protein
LGRALSRFEAGLERNVVIEALNDHLLALRFVLEGSGPAGLGLSMRVAALCAEPDDRASVKSVVDRASGLERELWSGEPAPGPATMTPAETAAALEELTRAILKDAACGHLGSDLRVTADEILLADGLAVGDGAPEQRGETAEWRLRTEDSLPELGEELGALDAAISAERAEDDDNSGDQPAEGSEEEQMMLVSEAVPTEIAAQEPEAAQAPAPEAGASPVLRLIEQTRAEREARHDRVADLFPRPEATDWNVREIAYDRTRRARVSEAETQAS